MHGLRDLRIIDLSNRIAGSYATKLMADAYADVIKVEPAEGEALRHWSASNQPLDPVAGVDGALFQFLACSKRSVVGQVGDAEILELIEGADLVVESFEPGVIDEFDLCERFPGLVLLSISAYGRGGPYSNRPASDLTIQAEGGGIMGRGLPSQPPLQCGNRITEWIGGTFAAVGALAAVQRAQKTGQGEHIDFSLCEVMNIGSTPYGDLMHSLGGRDPNAGFGLRTVEVPSIEPTLDGWVGFNTNSRQQFNDFCSMIERPDLAEDDANWWMMPVRFQRADEWNAMVRAWTTRHTTAHIVETASLFRIPVAPVNNGRAVFDHPHFQARGNFVPNPRSHFQQPAAPYLMDGHRPRPPEEPPTIGQHTGEIEVRKRSIPGISPSSAKDPALPLEGIRILDATAWWAGPSACQMLAHLGADVIRMESIQRPDGMRFAGALFMGQENWWERSGITLGANTNKRGITLNLTDPKGVELCKRLIETSDVFVENFSPRVVENFGLDWESVHAINPRTILIRMPAFGLSGPWRDNVGFAQTMEQISGLAWMTGHADDQPRIQRGPCDPLAGMHAAYAVLVALAEREKTGTGHLMECTMVEGALNAAAEVSIEYSAYGVELGRDGNRGPEGAPQNIYACPGEEQWLAVCVTSDAQWESLKDELGRPDWADDAELTTHAGRQRKHDLLDEKLSSWAATQELEVAVGKLIARGIPAAPVVDGRNASAHPHMKARGFFEPVDHPIVGTHPVPGAPFRYATVDRWHRTPTPTIGQHNREVLSELGLSDAELDQLEADEVIGYRPKGL